MLLPQKVLAYYNRELSYLRQYGAAFACRFPKIARRLGIAEGTSEDPHVERLVESFAFLTARIHQKIDEDMSELNNAIMEALAPQFLRQVPSVSVVQFQPAPEVSGMTGVLSVPRHTALISHPVGDVACRFRTVYPVEILPIDLCGVSLVPDPFDRDFILTLSFVSWPRAQFMARSIRLYLNGSPTIAHSLYELLLSQVSEWTCCSGGSRLEMADKEIRAVGFDEQEYLCADDMAINPVHHLFRDYSTLVEKFLFFDLPLPAGEHIPTSFEYRFRLKECGALRRIERICDKVNVETFRLNCTPVVNLFPHKAEPLTLSETEHEYLIQPDVRRSHSMEVYAIRSVEIFSRDQTNGRSAGVAVRPLLGIDHGETESGSFLFWQSTQKPSLQPNDRGMNMFISFADLRGEQAVPTEEVVMLHVLCTNRNVPQQLSNGRQEGDFDVECALPGVKVAGLMRPRPPLRPQQECNQNWRMVTQLNLNHMLMGGETGAQRLRETLNLYNLQNDTAVSRLIALLRQVDISPLCARLEPADPYSLARGLEVTLTFQAQADEYADFYLFCSVLERFIALYAPVNSFTQVVTRLVEVSHSEHRWPRRSGRLVWL